MGVFSRGARAPTVVTVIGAGTTILGDLRFSGGLHLDGMVEGRVTGEAGDTSALTISEKGRVKGDVVVDNLILNGEIVGDVRCRERVELASNARVLGTVYYRMLEMAMGAEVNGQLVRYRPEEEPPLLEGTVAFQDGGKAG